MGHLKMRLAMAAGMAFVFGVASAPAYPQETRDPRPGGATELSTVIDAWAHNSSQIKTLSAQFTRSGKGLGLGTVDYLYALKWKQSGQAVLDTSQVTRKNKTVAIERVVWTGKEIWLFRPHSKSIEVWRPEQMDDYGEFREDIKTSFAGRVIGSRMDLIFPTLRSPKEVDPLPFLIGFADSVARKRFRFELVPSKSLVVRAVPLEPELKSTYHEVLVTLDREQFLPRAIEYHTGRDGKEILRYKFLELTIDPALADTIFEPQKPEGWTIKSRSD